MEPERPSPGLAVAVECVVVWLMLGSVVQAVVQAVEWSGP